MPGKMVFLRKLTFAVAAIIFAAILHTPAPAQDDEAVLLLTAETWRMFPVLAVEPSIEEPALRLEQELKKLREENPGAYLADAGGSISLTAEQETAYDLPSAKFFDTQGYDVVNLPARDALLGTVRKGYQTSPRRYQEQTIAAVKASHPGHDSHLEPVRVVKKKGSMPLAFASLSSLDDASAITGLASIARNVDPELIAGQMAEARQDGAVLVAFSSWDEEKLASMLGNADAAPELIVDLKAEPAADVSRAGGAWVIAPPPHGKIFRVELERQAGELQRPRVSEIQYLTEEEWDGLIHYPVPNIGFDLPYLDDVVKRFFDVGAESVRVDRLNSDWPELTALPTINVYHLQRDEEPLRIYRVYFKIVDRRFDWTAAPGYPYFDFLAVLNGDSELVRVINNNKFPVGTLNTTIDEALNALSGTPPEEWKPDPELAEGLEDDLWRPSAEALKKVIELDKKLFGPGGPYSQD